MWIISRQIAIRAVWVLCAFIRVTIESNSLFLFKNFQAITTGHPQYLILFN